MFNIFYKSWETPINEETNLTLYAPDKEKQTIIIKGKWGQFKLNWICSKKKITIETKEKKIQGDFINAWSGANATDNGRAKAKKFVYDATGKKIIDAPICLTKRKENPFNITNLFEKKNKEKTKILKKGYFLTNWKKTKILYEKKGDKEDSSQSGHTPYQKIKPIFKIENIQNLTKEEQEEKEILIKQIKNIQKGISQRYAINLELKGIGYTAKVLETPKNDKSAEFTKELALTLGTSHEIKYPLKKNEIAEVKINTNTTGQNNFVTITLIGISYTALKKVAANLYSLKKPEPYKGKGIRYDGEKFFAKEKKKKKVNKKDRPYKYIFFYVQK